MLSLDDSRFDPSLSQDFPCLIYVQATNALVHVKLDGANETDFLLENQRNGGRHSLPLSEKFAFSFNPLNEDQRPVLIGLLAPMHERPG